MSDNKILEVNSSVIKQWLDGKIPDIDMTLRIKNYTEWRKSNGI